MQTSHILSFGRYLKAIRESKDIALTSVAQQLRVNVWQLMLVEAEDHAKLPDEVYVRGILRAYADAIGLDPDDIIDRYEINRKDYLRFLQSEKDLIQSGKQSINRMVIALGILAVVVIVSIAVFNRFESPVMDLQKETVSQNLVFDQVFYAEETIQPLKHEKNTKDRLYDRLHLKLVAISEILLDLGVDDGERERYTLNPQDEMHVEASRRLYLLINDAGGVKIYFNDREIDIDGEADRPVSVLFRKKEAEY